jgi:multicomponent K+:H+ antiporter subunit A
VTVGPLLAVGARAALGAPLPEYSLALWHGLSWPLAMSMLASLGGVLLYFGLQRFINLHRIVHIPRGGRELFVFAIDRVIDGTRWLTLALQNGRLQNYLALLVVMALVAGALPLLGFDLAFAAPATPLNIPSAAIALIGITATVAVVLSYRDRLRALVFLGAVGLVVALLFVELSAPDLALTQLLVELVTIILLLLALRWLPRTSAVEHAPVSRRLVSALLAIGAGVGAAALVWLVIMQPYDPISPYFLATALPLAGGTNAVNVILVDYRAFDTLGEITVLAVAALVIDALLAPMAARSGTASDDLTAGAQPSLMLSLSARLLLPFALLVAVYFFVRGHNLPGGGFIAGLVVAIALILQVIAQGERPQATMPRRYAVLIASGLAVAIATGLASLMVDFPLLTSTTPHPVVPFIGEVPLASAALFDLGVFLTVIGAAMLMLISIARVRPLPGSR